MLAGKTPPTSLAKAGKLPKSLTVAGNPAWRKPAGRERFAFSYLKQALGLSDRQAAALVGNMAVESRKTGPKSADLVPGLWQQHTPAQTHTFTDPNAGFGIAQWTYPARKEALKNFAGKLPVTSFAVELAFVAHELRHPLEQGHLLIQADTLAHLRNAQTIQEATAIVMAVYEHPTTYAQRMSRSSWNFATAVPV